MKQDPWLLLDTDIIAYQVAARNQHDFDWGDTGASRVVDTEKALRDCDEVIAEICDKLNSNRVIVCLSDPKVNFRKQLEPTYKSNRQNVEKPELLMLVKDYMAEEYRSFIRPRLEADDIMGILATSGDRFLEGDKIIVSEDKDMKTVPATLFNPRKHKRPVEVDRMSACRFLMEQTLTGDPTDGYIGCRGIGSKSPFVQSLKTAETPEELWEIVVEAYASKGRTEKHAIHQARLAHILWASSYNFKTKKIKLWTPEFMNH